MDYEEFIKDFNLRKRGIVISNSADFKALCERMEEDGWRISGDGYENLKISEWALNSYPEYQYLVVSRMSPHKVTASNSIGHAMNACLISLFPLQEIVNEAMMLIE